MCDATPYFHKATGRFILTGHAALYKDDELVTGLQRRDPLWSVYDDAKGTWLPFQALELPTEFYESGFGCSQLFEEPDGTLLIPAVTQTKAGKPVPTSSTAGCFVTRCRFDGSTLSLLDMGNIMDLPTGRGLCEPSIAFCGGRYFLCMRNDDTSYVSTSEDGLHFTTPQEWLFDDGSPLGSYNTQQHWLTGWWTRLYLVYTRRAGYNDHIFRHRAPLFMAEVDMERLRVKRDTEQVAVPMRGARLGNFGCCQTSPDSGVITAAEWMQTTGPDPFNYRRCMEFGSDNSIFVSTVNGM